MIFFGNFLIVGVLIDDNFKLLFLRKKMSTYKLTYFTPRALAEASRLVLHYAGQEFEDIRLSHDEFPLYKDCEFFGSFCKMNIEKTL